MSAWSSTGSVQGVSIPILTRKETELYNRAPIDKPELQFRVVSEIQTFCDLSRNTQD